MFPSVLSITVFRQIYQSTISISLSVLPELLPGDGVLDWVCLCHVAGIHNYWGESILRGQPETSKNRCHPIIGLNFALYTHRLHLPQSFLYPFLPPMIFTRPIEEQL